MHKAITYRMNPHVVFRKGFRTGYRPPLPWNCISNLAVRKVYFLHSLKIMATDSRRLSILTVQVGDGFHGGGYENV